MMHVVGKDIPHDSAAGHVSGESQFLDDAAPLAGELLAGIVPCPVAHGRLTHLDVAAAPACAGREGRADASRHSRPQSVRTGRQG